MCGHTFHYKCVQKHIENGYAHHRITFEHTRCPLCKEPIQHWAFEESLAKWALLEADVNERALNRLRIEGNEKHREIVEPWGQFHGNPLGFANHIYVFYQCYKCKKPYFAGNQICGAADDEEDDEDDEEIAKQLLCSSCGTHNIETCEKHGREWIQYVVFERNIDLWRSLEAVSMAFLTASLFENINRECGLDFDVNSNTNARTQVQVQILLQTVIVLLLEQHAFL